MSIGTHRLPLDPTASRETIVQRSREMLCRALNMRTTVAFLGAGCSAPLGYPTWRGFAQKLLSASIQAMGDEPSAEPENPDLSQLKRFRVALEGGADVDADRLIFMLGACQKALSRRHRLDLHEAVWDAHVGPTGRNQDYERILKEMFQSPARDAPQDQNPYMPLLKLPIGRFVTTNYDDELKNAIDNSNEFGVEDVGFVLKDPRVKSFNQTNYRELAQFVTSRVEYNQLMIFHCHGSCDQPESMVVTETDYQWWYLRKLAPEGTAFRQTVELLFRSSPVLFVGFGMGDQDLLHQLRRFVAEGAERLEIRSSKAARRLPRPLFALMESQGTDEDHDYHDRLYERYGVHVIPYPAPTASRDRGRALCQALEELRNEWMATREGWLRKPLVRAVEIPDPPPRPYQHYTFRRPNEDIVRAEGLYGEVMKYGNQKGGRLVVLVGDGGTGKSWEAMRILRDWRPGAECGSFFWSSYYSDDPLTGLDRAIVYLSGDIDIRESRIERFRGLIRKNRHLLIFDGIERFLRVTKRYQGGEAYSPHVREFLQVLADEESQSTVILTSRLWPTLLKLSAGVGRLDMTPFASHDLLRFAPYNALGEKRVSALCSLLNGHRYSIVLAGRILARAGDRNRDHRLRVLQLRLSNVAPDRRPSNMIGEAIRDADEAQRGGHLVSDFLSRVTLFMSPVTRRTMALCLEAAQGRMSSKPSASSDLDDLIKDLVERDLLFEVRGGPDAPREPAFTAHPMVRAYFFGLTHSTRTNELPNFTLPGFTAGRPDVDPGTAHGAEVVREVFLSLEGAARKACEGGDKVGARVFCRSAFSVIRSRMQSTTTARWGSYQQYLELLIRLADLAKRISPDLWDFRERERRRQDVESSDGPLYADELAWLYHEIGITYYGEGSMLDALGVWEQSHEINRIIDNEQDGGQYLFQALCNLGAAFLQLGHLGHAEAVLQLAQRANARLNDVDHEGRIEGYLALAQHLRGNLDEADTRYRDALKKIRRGGRNRRAECIFRKHLCDLKLKQSTEHLGKSNDLLCEAEEEIRRSRDVALAGGYYDVAAHTRLTIAHLHRRKGRFRQASAVYAEAMTEARTIGIRGLEADILSEQSRLSLKLHDNEQARQRAMEGLSIANELSLGLRQTHGLVVLGLATISAGDRRMGVEYLRNARRLAIRQGYLLRGREAEQKLLELGEPLDGAE